MSRNKESASMRVKARAYLHSLVMRQKRRCFWCDRWLIMSSEVGKKNIVRADDREVVWLEKKGLTLSAGRATTDHVLALSRGGDNSFKNLVAACWECNNDRGLMNAPHPRAQSRADKERLKNRVLTERDIAFRARVELRRKERPCKHPSFENQTDAFLFADKLIRLGVKAMWRVCPRCSRYRVHVAENLSARRHRKLIARLQVLKADPFNEGGDIFPLIG